MWEAKNPIQIRGIGKKLVQCKQKGTIPYFGHAYYIPFAPANLISHSQARKDKVFLDYDKDKDIFCYTHTVFFVTPLV